MLRLSDAFIDILIRCLEGITMKVLLGFFRSVCSVFALLFCALVLFSPSSAVGAVYTDTVEISSPNAVLSGEYYIRPLTEEVVPLEGDTMDVLAAGEEEWNSVLMEVLFSFISLSGQMDTGN